MVDRPGDAIVYSRLVSNGLGSRLSEMMSVVCIHNYFIVGCILFHCQGRRPPEKDLRTYYSRPYVHPEVVE